MTKVILKTPVEQAFSRGRISQGDSSNKNKGVGHRMKIINTCRAMPPTEEIVHKWLLYRT
jgi:hypothetical protein